jgi:hypothetical protein
MATTDEPSHIDSQLVKEIKDKVRMLESAVFRGGAPLVARFVTETTSNAQPGDGLAVLTLILKGWISTPQWWLNAKARIVFMRGTHPEGTHIDIRDGKKNVSLLDAIIFSPVPIDEFSEALYALNESFPEMVFHADVIKHDERAYQIALSRREIPGRLPPYVELSPMADRAAFRRLIECVQKPAFLAELRESKAPPTVRPPASSGTSGMQSAMNAQTTEPCRMTFSEPPPDFEIPGLDALPTFPDPPPPKAVNGDRR